MHKVLDRQIKKFFANTDDIPKECKQFLEIVSHTYEGFDEDRSLLERSLGLSSKELTAINKNLEIEKAKDEAILTSVGDGLIVTDTERKVLMMNRPAETMLGWAIADLEGKPLSDFIPVEDKDGQFLPVEKMPLYLAISSRQKITANAYFYVRKDQTKFPVAVTAAPVIMGREVIGGVLIFRDIAKEYDVDKAKTEFVSLASHQMRTPLSTVRWYTEMLLADDAGRLNDQQKKYLEVIYASNRRMIELINSLLNVSRLELGTFAVEPEPTNLADLAEQVLKESEHIIRSSQFKIRKDYDAALPAINIDPKLMRMVFQNLISNAVKYTPPGGEIRVSIKKREKNLAIEVADNGYGIPQYQQSRVFTKLFRADNIKEKDSEGTGLGLYIVKSIIDQAGGTIRFESVENKGTTFYVTIPLEGMIKKEGNKFLT